MELFWYNIKEMDAAAYDAALAMMDTARRARVKELPNEAAPPVRCCCAMPWQRT